MKKGIFLAAGCSAIMAAAMAGSAWAQAPAPAEDGYVGPGVAFAVGGAQVVGHGGGFFAQGGQADDEGRFGVGPIYRP